MVCPKPGLQQAPGDDHPDCRTWLSYLEIKTNEFLLMDDIC